MASRYTTELSQDYGILPEWKTCYKIESSNEARPNVPYAQMIIQAIGSSPDQKSTLKEIYEYVMSRYPYFRSTRSGWKNSIRHNLSLNKNFVRVARPANEKGKGAYWAINPNQNKPEKKGYKKRYGSPRMTITPSEPIHIVSSAAEYAEHPYIQYESIPQDNFSYNFEWEQLPQEPNWTASDYSQLEQLLDMDKTSVQTSQNSEYYRNGVKHSTNSSEYYLRPSDEMIHIAKPQSVERSNCEYETIDSLDQFFDPRMWTKTESQRAGLQQYVTIGEGDESQQFLSDQYHSNSDYSTILW